ncbi:MAG: RNA polymerase sigma factor [Phycisphaerae bacterium]|jgi:RNA polymerase sigma-70 factor (ECF subfamily)
MASVTLDVEALRTLVSEAQSGSRLAADRLVREHDGWVRSVIYGVVGQPDLVDDIAQQVWAQVWERLGSLQDPDRLRSWLYSVARNAAIDAGQAHKRRRGAALDTVAEGLNDWRVPTPARLAAGDETHELLLRAIQALPVIYREPFVLRHLEDWTYAEIGALLGLPIETVETRLVRARRLLREMLKDKVES